MRPSALLRRLWRAQLRLRVMAGVVIVMLVTIEVHDDGPGVPPGKLPHIFERFYRAADTRAPRAPRAPESARPPGSGLGLAIAAEIAAAHGGAATAAPVSPHGLWVTLTLPARQESPAYAGAGVSAQA